MAALIFVNRRLAGALLMAQGAGRIDAEASKSRDERGDECRAEEQADGGAEGRGIGRLYVEEKRGQQPTGGESADRACHDTQDGGNQRLTEPSAPRGVSRSRRAPLSSRSRDGAARRCTTPARRSRSGPGTSRCRQRPGARPCGSARTRATSIAPAPSSTRRSATCPSRDSGGWPSSGPGSLARLASSEA